MSYLFTILICAVNFESYTVFFVSNMIFYPYDLLFIGWQAAPKIIPLTRKGKQLTRKVGVNFYGFIFFIATDIFGQFRHKKCAADKEKTLSLGSTFTRCTPKTAQAKGLFETEIIEWSVKIYRVVSLRIKIGVRTL